MTKAKNTTLSLTVSVDYVRSWGLWEAVRELVQNALDARDAGYEMRIEYKPELKKPRLSIITEGCTIGRDKLVLGGTGKIGTGARGKFGEGFKLAWLSTLRAGLEIWAKSGDERWIPRIGKDANFDNAEILLVDAAPARFEDVVRCDIVGLHPDDWAKIKARILDLTPPKKQVVVSGHGAILLDAAHRGMLFSRGLYVGRLPGDTVWGYDLHHVDLDRDRKMADPWTLKSSIQNLLMTAVKNDLLPARDVYKAVGRAGSMEADAFRWYDHDQNFAEKMAALFFEDHGEGRVPVTGMEQEIQAAQMGLEVACVEPTLAKILEGVTGSFAEAKEARRFADTKSYRYSDLAPEYRQNLVAALDLIKNQDVIATDHLSFLVVDFVDERLNGVHGDGKVRLAHKILADPRQLLATLVHEIAHERGDDGTTAHRAAIEAVFADIVVRLASGF